LKKILSILFLFSVLSSCIQDDKKTIPENDLANRSDKPIEISDLPWSAVLDSTSQKIKMAHSAEVETQDLDPSNVTEILVRKYPEIKIIWIKQQKDIAFVSIPDASFLTQSAGSMGASIFMAEVTYSFTEIPGIRFVNFSFSEGEHASPGTYQRSDFNF
jgi:hypothetical protein